MRRPLLLLLALSLLLTACDSGPGPVAGVCEGTPNEQAPATTDPDGTTVALYLDDGEGYEFTSWAGEEVGDFSAIVPEAAGYVGCLTVAQQVQAITCPYEDDHVLELRIVDYNLDLRAASTGESVATTTIPAPTDADCPFLVNFDEGREQVDHARNPAALRAFYDQQLG